MGIWVYFQNFLCDNMAPLRQASAGKFRSPAVPAWAACDQLTGQSQGYEGEYVIYDRDPGRLDGTKTEQSLTNTDSKIRLLSLPKTLASYTLFDDSKAHVFVSMQCELVYSLLTQEKSRQTV